MHWVKNNLLFLFFIVPIQVYSANLANSCPKNFLWGVGICEFQNSGAINCPESNWALWEQPVDQQKPHILNGQQSGKSCDFWNNYEEDIQQAKSDLHINSFRFSIAWDRVQPTTQDSFDQAVLDHYEDVIDELLAHDMVPMITLHHFVNPIWFDELGGFEKEENIHFFVDFCAKIFDRFAHKVPIWCTINEPTIYMFQGYMRGVFPPGKKNIRLAVTVLKNLMIAHTQVYQTLKSMPHGNNVQIGIVHQYLKFFAYHQWNIIEKLPGWFLNNLLNDSVLSFLRTGIFKLYLPLTYDAYYQAPESPLLDFIGLNYYSRVLIQMQASFAEPIKSGCYPDEIMTDMPYAAYPRGLYEAIADVASINVPIYVTENGIADAKDDRRAHFIKDYLGQLVCAIKDGYDVRGYYYWSLMDNWEWDLGFTMKFGLYAVDFTTQERRLREGSKTYAQIIDHYSSSCIACTA